MMMLLLKHCNSVSVLFGGVFMRWLEEVAFLVRYQSTFMNQGLLTDWNMTRLLVKFIEVVGIPFVSILYSFVIGE
jgi:hypothetical protein